MQIDAQRLLAHNLLKKIQRVFPDAVLAGGAVRDWYFEQEAKDLDFFIPHRPSQEVLERLVGFPLKPATEKVYEGADFTTYNLDGLCMPVQIMSCNVESGKEVVDRFPCNLSKAWYDGEEFHYDPFFLLGVKYGYIIGYPSPLVNKTFRKYPGFKYWAFNKNYFFECIGEKRKPAEPPRGLGALNGVLLGANADRFLFDDDEVMGIDF